MKRGGPNHPKTYALAEALGIRRVQAIGTLELLFHFTAQYAPEGDVGRYSDKRIAAALDWCGSVAKLIDSLVTCGWVDRHPVARLVVHGWAEHADRATLQKLSRAGKKPIQSNHEDAENSCTQTETSGFNLGSLPEPEPEPTLGTMPAPHTQPEPTHTPLRVRRAPTASETTKPPSQHFEEWWTRWVEITGLNQHKDEAARAWVSVVKAADEEQVSQCLERYAASDRVARQVIQNPENWIFEQARNRWQGGWPRKRPLSSHETKQQQSVDELAAL